MLVDDGERRQEIRLPEPEGDNRLRRLTAVIRADVGPERGLADGRDGGTEPARIEIELGGGGRRTSRPARQYQHRLLTRRASVRVRKD